MTLLEQVIELDTMLANDGYKSWGYARLTLDKVIKALQAPPDVNPHVGRSVCGFKGQCEHRIADRCHLVDRYCAYKM